MTQILIAFVRCTNNGRFPCISDPEATLSENSHLRVWLASCTGHTSPWVGRKTFQVWAVHCLFRASLKILLYIQPRWRKSKKAQFSLSRLVTSTIVSLKNNEKRKFIIMYSARSATAWIYHQKKELALRQLKRNRCLTTASFSRRIWLIALKCRCGAFFT